MFSIKKVAVWLISIIALATVMVAIFGNPKLPMPKEQVQRNAEILSLAQRSDLVHFNNAWYVVLENHKNGKQITIKSSFDRSINTYAYHLVADWNDFKMFSNPNPNNDYSKTLLNYFVGVSN